MKLLTIRLSNVAIETLNQEADAREMTLSAMCRALMCAGAAALGEPELCAVWNEQDFVSHVKRRKGNVNGTR